MLHFCDPWLVLLLQEALLKWSRSWPLPQHLLLETRRNCQMWVTRLRLLRDTRS
ncbi:hypothetical protein BGX27_004178, partial [Mortierella sp. AM989]